MQVEKTTLKDSESNFVTITIDGENPELLIRWLDSFIDFVGNYTLQNVRDMISVKIKKRKAIIQEKINGLRQTAEKRRLDKIAVLEEAATIADKLHLDGNVSSTYYSHQNIEKEEPTIIVTNDIPDYLRGTRALKVETQVLKDRKSDDPFIDNLRGLQEELFFLEKIQTMSIKNIHAIRVDQRAIVLEQPVKPKRSLIVAIGLVVGMSIGVLVGFLTNHINTRPQET